MHLFITEHRMKVGSRLLFMQQIDSLSQSIANYNEMTKKFTAGKMHQEALKKYIEMENKGFDQKQLYHL